ncbi:hypothetical protein GF415_01095 [Candidatus Micrarchaeota archaeon]|nr:hypothetical protein [Candidatus Micrarchaeota archaeon]
MGNQKVRGKTEDEKSGREKRVNRIADEMYESISGIKNKNGETLLYLEDIYANKIAELDPESPTALKEMKQLLDGFYDAVDKDFSFIVGNYDVKYNRETLRSIQENLIILDEKNIRENLKNIANASLDSINDTAKEIVRKREKGLEKPSNSDNPLAIGTEETGGTATQFNNILVGKVSGEVSDILTGANIKMTTRMDGTGLKKIILSTTEKEMARHEEVPEFQKKHA